MHGAVQGAASEVGQGRAARVGAGAAARAARVLRAASPQG
jgi:hypothetical protein